MPGGPFDRIFADVRKDLPSVADAVLRQELFRVMDDFTQRTNIWQEVMPLVIQPNVTTYNLPAPAEGKISRLMFVYDAAQPSRYWPMGGISMRVPGVLVLPRAPNSAANWNAIVAKRTAEPLNSDHYTDIDVWITEKYADTIGRGILARLQFEPQKPYSNPMLAKVNQQAYISGCSLARANDSHANVFNAQNWMFPQGWSTITRKPWT
jgi:hypothetical protein